MNKITVIYESKYGFTLRYAKWISEALSCKLLEQKNVRPKDLEETDTIIYGGGLYAGGIILFSGKKLYTARSEEGSGVCCLTLLFIYLSLRLVRIRNARRSFTVR